MAARMLNSVSLVSKVTLGGFSATHTHAVSPSRAAKNAMRNQWPRKTLLPNVEMCAGYVVSLRGSGQGVNATQLPCEPEDRSYPFTLMRENESTAVPDVGRPIDVAGRKVVKISIFFTCGGRSLFALGFDNTR